MKRKKEMKRGTGFKARSHMKRGTTQLKRTTRIKPQSKKMVKRRAGWEKEVDRYFGKKKVAPCQSCGEDLHRLFAKAHHKQLRSQGGGDEPENLVILCPICHIQFIHDGLMSAQTQSAQTRCKIVFESTANATNRKKIQWPPVSLQALQALKERWG